MQIQSEHRGSEPQEARNEHWAARPVRPPRSIFANFREDQKTVTVSPGIERKGAETDAVPLQAGIEIALARSEIYRFLAKSYEDPSIEGWQEMINYRPFLETAVRTLAPQAPAVLEVAVALTARLSPECFSEFHESYLAAFGHAARGNCPLNEIEYGERKGNPLFQPHRLADLAGFYGAFGLEVSEDAGERCDHICLELEFMCVLAAKEAYALEHQLDSEDLALCRHAQEKFLREHLGGWAPAFARRLARIANGSPLGAIANLTRAFIEAECVRQGVTPGSEDLLLRPVDEAEESLCGSCGVTQLPPGSSERI